MHHFNEGSDSPKRRPEQRSCERGPSEEDWRAYLAVGRGGCVGTGSQSFARDPYMDAFPLWDSKWAEGAP